MSVPEFILKKLVVPGSYKKKPDGFSFRLFNTFAPATVLRLQIIIGGEQLPDDCVSIAFPGLPERPVSSIKPETSVTMPVGIEICITAKHSYSVGVVRVRVTTKEAGDLEFSLDETKPFVKHESLKPGFLSHLRSPKKSVFTITSQTKIGAASPFITGHFIEHLERCIYDGIWTSDGSDYRQDTLDLIRQLHPSIIRYPGGNFASGYHWEDGIGPRVNRPSRHDAAWQSEESNQVGTDEFLSFCEELDIEPILVVNDGSGSPEEAARWVAYCNSPSNSEQGGRRLINGHP